MNQIRQLLQRIISPAPVQALPTGTFHYQAPPDSETHYRLHLRIEPDGSGLLIVNASTILHLNQTAAEYAYHLVKQTPEADVAKLISARYRVSPEQAAKDFADLRDRIQTMILMPDLDPVSFLDFERQEPHSGSLSAPLRVDIALTYRIPEGTDPRATPRDRVRRELTHAEWQAILVKTWEAGIPHIVFTGGEPTLRSDLPDLIEQAEKQDQVTGLLTNGLRLAETAYLHKLLQSGLDHLMLVFQPELDESWEALRDVLVEDLFVTVHLTLTPHNKEQVTELLDRLAGMGVKSISLSASHPDLSTELETARRAAAERGLSLVWDLPVPYSALHPVALETDQAIPSGAGKAWLYIEPDGDVLPAQGAETILGNLLEQPWAEIWKRT